MGGLFITGTDTGVEKLVVTAQLGRMLSWLRCWCHEAYTDRTQER
jgi:dethiobiotin synthetase